MLSALEKKIRHLLNVLQGDYTTVRVKFKNQQGFSPKEYTYKADKKLALKVEDLVVVDSPYNGISLCVVTGVDEERCIDFNADYSYKWIVGKVDRTLYDAKVAKEEAFVKQITRIEAQVEERKIRGEFAAKFEAAGLSDSFNSAIEAFEKE